MDELEAAVTRATVHSSLSPSPSRLTSIKLSRSDVENRAIALDLERPLAYVVRTQPPSRGFVADDPILSPKDDGSQHLLIRGDGRASSLTVSDGRDQSADQSDANVSIEELRNQVWSYSHTVSAIHSESKPTEFPGQISDNESIPIVSRGKRRLLTAIGAASPTEEDPLLGLAMTEREVLGETNYCARRLADYMQKHFMDLPDFLEQKTLRDGRVAQKYGTV
jgi:hypothetical protein